MTTFKGPEWLAFYLNYLISFHNPSMIQVISLFQVETTHQHSEPYKHLRKISVNAQKLPQGYSLEIEMEC